VISNRADSLTEASTGDSEALRLATLHSYNILDTAPEESFDRVTRLAARLFSVPKASVSLVDVDRVWFKSRTGIAAEQLPRGEAFCSKTVLSNTVMVISDAAADPRYENYPAVAKAGGVRFYAGAPLVAPNGMALGTLCILDVEPREFSSDDARMLADLAVLVVDQLELRHVAEQLRQSSKDYRGLFENSPVGVYRTSPEGRILMANPAILNMLGYSSTEELLARNIENEDLVQQRRAWRTRLESAGEITGYESIWYDRDGRSVPVRESTRVVRDADGQILFYEGWAEDISRQKAAEQERRQAQDLLQEIFGTVTDLLYVYDFEKQRTTYSNRPLAKMLGYGDIDISLFKAGAAELIHPADSAAAMAYLARCCNQKNGEVCETELRIRNGQGEWRWLYTRNSVFERGESGEALRMLGLAADVTDRHRLQDSLRRQEERWALALAANNDGLWDWDAVNNQVFHSARWKEMLGYSADEVVDWDSIIHPEDAERVKTSIQNYLNHTAPRYREEYQLLAKDGSYRWILARGIAQWDQDGQPLRMVGSHSDITQQRQAELVLRLQTEALARAKEKAESAALARSSFLATMSHEIRTPLNGIIGMTGILADTALSAEQKDFLQTIRTSGEALLAIISDILDFSKIESGHMELERQDFDLWHFIEETVSLVAATAHTKGLELTAPIDPATPRFVQGDPSRLRQILLNLLSNAVKFTQQGEVSVKVSLLSQTENTAALRFEVADTGIGISERGRLRIFDPFTQEDSSTTRRFGGTGLGLAICKQLVSLMGGEIGVESQQGAGSTFWFTVTLGANAVTGVFEDARLRGRRVLVVDDNRTNRRFLEQLLQACGVQVTSADDGISALRLLLEYHKGQTPFDLALLDFQMPLMDGLMLTRSIRSQQQFAKLPIVMLSSVPDQDRSVAEELGVYTSLMKPLRRGQLLAAIHGALAGSNGKTDSVRSETPATVEKPVEKERGHVLLAEDNPVNQKVCGLILKKAGYTFEIVSNGLEALAALDRSAFGAILLDCQMPEMDGFEAARAIRQRSGPDSRVPIIALTANAMSGERERCLSAGMDDYLAKPIRPEQLAATLALWVRQQGGLKTH